MKKKMQAIFQKLSDFYDRHEVVLVVLITLIFNISVSFHFKFYPYDYLWNFGNIYKLHLGYQIYKEVAIIITPIFFAIGKILFDVFGANYFVYNWFNVIIQIIFYIEIFIILKKIIKSIKLRDIVLFGFIIFFGKTFGENGPNYNLLSACFINGIIIATFYSADKKIRRTLNGILAALAFLTYQKAGVAAILIITIYELWNKSDSKLSQRIVNLIISAISMILVFAIYAFYLQSTNNFQSFINMTVLGVKSFSDNFAVVIAVMIKLVFFTILSIVIFAGLLKFKKNNDCLLLLFATNISTIVYLYPIINAYHGAIWTIYLALFIAYSINIIFDEIELNTLKQNITMLILVVSFIIFCFTNYIYNRIQYPMYVEQKTMFFGSTISDKEKNEIQEINSYIKEHQNEYEDIIVFSSYAMLYDNTYNNNYKYFDLPNNGNFGPNGEQELINRILQMNNTLILVQNEETEYELYQFPNNVRNFIHKNYEPIDKLQNYDIYEINNK